MRKFRPRLTSVLTAAALGALTCAGSAAFLTPTASAASSGAVVNEVYGGGGNSGATLTNDFIELANIGSAGATLDGWSVQYLPASPTAASTWQVTPLTARRTPTSSTSSATALQSSTRAPRTRPG